MKVHTCTTLVALFFDAVFILSSVYAKVGDSRHRTAAEELPPAKAKQFQSVPLPLPKNVIKQNEPVFSKVLSKSKQSTRIVGGTPVAGPDVYPFFVSWQGCGGSLIHPDIVLTAAHCNAIYSNYLTVNAYKLDDSTTEGAESRAIDEKRVHPEYNWLTIEYDIMVLKLASPVKATPIQLNDDPEVPAVGENLTVIGLGHTEDGGYQSDILQEVNVARVSDEDCDEAYFGEVHRDSMFCAGVPEGGKDSCQGDSGGPIFTVTESGQVDKQVGVVSWGAGCGEVGAPGVYAEVSAVQEWIFGQICVLSAIRPDNCPDPTPAPTPIPPGPNEAAVTIAVTTDSYPHETSWELIDETEALVEKVLPGDYLLPTFLYETVVNLQLNDTYTFTIFDSYSDGLGSEGGYEVTVNGVVLASGGQFSAFETTTFVVHDGDQTQTLAPEGDTTVKVNIMTDEYPQETYWTLYNNWGSIVSRAPVGTYTLHNHLYTTTLNLAADIEYVFNISDTQGDGMCCMYGDGYYEIKMDGADGEILVQGGQYQYSETRTFTIPEVPTGGAGTASPTSSPGTCGDTDALVEIDSAMGEKSCSWLAANLERYGYLCQFVDVAAVCPATCKWCSLFG